MTSKLRGCDLLKLRVSDVMHSGKILSRAIVIQQKTQKPVQFEITEQTHDSVRDLINAQNLTFQDYLFKSRFKSSKHLSTRQYAQIVKNGCLPLGF